MRRAGRSKALGPDDDDETEEAVRFDDDEEDEEEAAESSTGWLQSGQRREDFVSHSRMQGA